MKRFHLKLESDDEGHCVYFLSKACCCSDFYLISAICYCATKAKQTHNACLQCFSLVSGVGEVGIILDNDRLWTWGTWSQMIICPTAPQVGGVHTIILLLPTESEPPRSRIVNIKHLWLIPRRRQNSCNSQWEGSRLESVSNQMLRVFTEGVFHSICSFFSVRIWTIFFSPILVFWCQTQQKPEQPADS